MPTDLELAQPVSFDHFLVREKSWQDGIGTVVTWMPYPTGGRGFVVGWRTLSDGIIEQYRESDGYGGSTHVSNEWRGTRYFRAYIVTYDLRCKPLWVLPEHLTEVD